MPGVYAPVIEAIQRYRAALLAGDAKRAAELVAAYGRIWQRLRQQLTDLERAQLAGESDRAIKVRINALLQQIEQEISRYAVYADTQTEAAIIEAIEAAMRDAPRIAQAAYPRGGDVIINAIWNRLPTEAVETMLGMLSGDSPLHQRMTKTLGEAVTKAVSDQLVQGIAQSWNPTKTQAIIRRTLGRGLEWSLTSTRTATLWAYREANRANMVANQRLVRAWRWTCARSARTCLSCINQDGTIHPLTKTLNDHHSGRCVAVPIMASYADLGLNIPEPLQDTSTARQWFEAQSEAQQRAMMGNTAWDEWKAGKFGLQDYSRPYQDEVYGEMLRQATLEELLRKEAA